MRYIIMGLPIKSYSGDNVSSRPKKELSERAAAYLERIRALREDHDLSQEKAGSLVFIAQRTYSGYERGESRFPLEVAIALAEYYDVDMNYFCGLTKKKKPFPKK